MKSPDQSPVLLAASGYQASPCQNLWVRGGKSEDFSYTDGADVEKKILDILKNVSDLSIDSRELAANISDWPTEYHFNARRANLLRPISDLLRGSVLEIGAGCGAISRFAGECGAEVIALEGSHIRARIAAERCRDLPNVSVVCDRFDLFSIKKKFDTILLIGVLEYAKIFAPADQADPVQWMLKSARELLAPAGCLIVAIENKLGLKYFAGCTEDHIGVPYYGIEGLYRAKEAITFGRKELAGRLSAAGLIEQRLLLPFPDYKIPEVILDAEACESNEFDTSAFLGLSTGRDYAGPTPLAFSQALVWQALSDNGIVPDLSNSFLFVCSAEASRLGRMSSRNRAFAWSYSVERRRELLTDTRIAADGKNLAVFKERRYPQLAVQLPAEGAEWSQRIEERVSYVSGERLDVVLLRAAASADAEEFFRVAQGWLELLTSKSFSTSEKDQSAIANWLCAGDAVDLIPRNIVITADGTFSVFDQEWVKASPISLAWLLVRGILSFAPLVVNGSWVRSESIFSLSQMLARRISLELSEEDLLEIQRMDAGFLTWVRGDSSSVATWDVGMLKCPIGLLNASMVKLANAASAPREEYRSILSNLEARLDAERIAHARLIGAYHATEASNKSLLSELVSAHADAASLQERQSHLDAEILRLSTAAGVTHDECGETLRNLEARLDAERMAHARLIGEFQATEARNKSLVAELASAHACAATFQERQIHLDAEVLRLNNAAAATREEYAGILGNLEARLDTERIAHARLIGESQATEARNNSLASELIAAHAFAAALKERQIHLDAEKVQHAKLLAAYQLLEKAHQEVVLELDSTRECLGLESSKLRDQLLGAQCRVSDLERTLDSRESNLRELGGTLNAMHDISVRQENRTLDLERSNQALIERLKALEKQLQEVESSYKLSESSLRDLKDNFKDVQERRAVLENTVLELERHRSAMNAEILRLNAERATFGARIGRSLTGIRARIAPVGTRRGKAITLLGRFGDALATEGLGNALARTRKFSAFKYRAWHFRREMLARSQSGAPSAQGVSHADHPQLSAWIAANEPDQAVLAKQRLVAAGFAYKPLISVVVPIYKVPRDVLNETLASLEAQTYADWQACIVWADIDDLEGWSYLQQRVAADKRFTIRLLEANGGISLNSDAALELVAGEFVALLDHDDTLTPWALFEVVQRLQSTPDLDFIYSDKDGITADGSMRLNALFKPEWSPEMLHSVNYLTHLNVMRTSILREIGGWRPETDGAQDWDLFFRITERTDKIARLPSIHYHWRILPTSTATGLQAKPYAAQGQLRAQQDHFRRRGLPAIVIPSPEGMFNIRWPVELASVDVLVFQRGRLDQLVNVLDVLRAGQLSAVARIHVCHSEALTPALLAFESVWGDRIVFTHVPDLTWRTALAQALPSISSKTLILIDGAAAGLSETLVDELSGWVAHHPDIAWASAIALNPEGTVFEAGRVMTESHATAPLFSGTPLFSFGWFGGPLWYRNSSACSPYAIAVSVADLSNAIESMPSIEDPARAFASLCEYLRRHGKRGLINPFARVYFTEAPESHWDNDARLYANDPYFNPSFVGVSPLQLHS